MKIDTKPFGPIEIDETAIIDFPEGILAFEHLRQYVLLSTKENSNFHWLQSVEKSDLAFLVVRPHELLQWYNPQISTPALSNIGLQRVADSEVWAILTVPPNDPEKMTINLQGPLVLNRQKGYGGQFISEDESHEVRMLVLDLIERGGPGEC